MTPARTRPSIKHILVVLAALSLLLTTLVAGTAQAVAEEEDIFTLTLLHNNDGESQLIDAGSGIEDFGGVARFASQVRLQRADARANTDGSLLLSSGDNFLAGPEFNASLDKGVPFYDTIALDLLRYDAISFGNHDFDFGPDVLADFLSGYSRLGRPPYLGANVDFSAEPVLQAFVDAGVISGSTVKRVGGEFVGIIGALTPQLSFISSPRDVTVDADIAGIVQAEVDSMTARGIDKIVFISHLQSIDEDVALAAELDNVDVMIAGGGDEVLANDGDLLVPNDVVFGPYPTLATDSDGTTVPVVTTAGDYKYLGRLDVEFDSLGNVVGWSGGPIRIAGGDNPDAVPSNRTLQRVVVDPVAAFLEDLANNVIGTSEVDLNGVRDPGIRTQETGLGSLLADALLWQAQDLAADFGQPAPVVGLQNGGGIRNNNVIPAGDFTELNTFEIAPFANFVSIVPDIPREQFKQILENAYSSAPAANGRFAQVAGFTVEYSLSGTPMDIDDATGEIVTEGTRVQSVILDDGTVIVENGAVVAGDPVTIATIDFLANGGDEYPYMGAAFTRVGVTYQQALSGYVQGPLGGLITAADYPFDGAGRIVQLP